MSKILITGSRSIAPPAFSYIAKVCDRIKELDWTVIVGDAPGVDTCVVNCCLKRGIPVYSYAPNDHAPRIDGAENIPVVGYYARDRWMAERCDRVLAIWNGRSRGTRYTFEYARKLGKQVDVRIFR